MSEHVFLHINILPDGRRLRTHFFTHNARSQTVPYASEHVFLHCSVRERQPTRQAGSRTPSSSNLPMLLKLPSRNISLHIDQRLLQGRILPSPSNACQPIEIINFQILPGLRKLLSHNWISLQIIENCFAKERQPVSQPASQPKSIFFDVARAPQTVFL